MMKLENSLFPSTVVMTPSKSMKYATRTQEELEDVSWKERSKPTQ